MAEDLRRHLLDTWAIHARTVLFVLAAVEPAALAIGTTLKGRSAGKQFAHMHNVRLMWLQAAAPELLEGLQKFDADQAPDKAGLTSALEASSGAIGELVARGLEAGRIKRFKPHPTAFVGYLVAHESFHQGDIGVRLTESGHPLNQKTTYGMWEWGSR